jgi:DNA invertase Pin-like site-specific DNA recombinase
MPEQSEQTKRAVAYVRESTEEQGRGYSPDGQRQAIARYAADHGLRLTEEYLDFETGRAADKRPSFQRLIEDAMERRFDVVLVFHTAVSRATPWRPSATRSSCAQSWEST